MKVRNIKLVFQREIRDQLRDRRTLFMVLVLPLLLYPAMGVGLMQMALLFNESPRTIVVLGNQHLPEEPSFIENGKIARRLFNDQPQDADLLNLILEQQEQGSVGEQNEELVSAARNLVDLSQSKQQIDDWADDSETDEPSAEQVELERKIATAFLDFEAEVLIAIPEGFGQFVEEFLSQKEPMLTEQDEFRYRPLVLFNSAEERSDTAYRKLAGALMQWERELLKAREENLNIPGPVMSPLFEYRISDGDRRNVEDVAIDEQVSANFWSRFLPPILILMTLTGAFYPAIDLGAGEKERGTMETLLISPATRSEIVIGKFFTILIFSLITANLNLVSMGLTGFYVVSQADSAVQSSQFGDLALPSFGSFFVIGVLMIPLGALFSAMSLALATFAKSTKEGQYYLTPMMLVVMGSTMFCMSPGIELTPFNSVIPIVGLGLLLKSVMLSPISSLDVAVYIVPVMVTSIGYSLLALWWAIDQFHKEDVLFRESEKFDLRHWFRHLLREKEALPTTSEAVFCFVLIMAMQFLSMGTFQRLLTDQSLSPAVAALRVLAVTQLVVIATPALLMGVMLTSNIRATFRLRMPRLKWLAFGLFLPMILQPLAIELQYTLSWFFPPLPEHIGELLSSMSDVSIPVWQLLAVFALAPGVCEELAFRGLILSGFSRGGRTTIAILFSALLFGVMHMIPQQVFNGFLLGLVLGLLAIRSGSLLPCVLFHFVNNAMGVLPSRLSEDSVKQISWLVEIRNSEPRFTVLSLIACAIAGALLVSHLIRAENDHSPTLESQSGAV